MAKAVGKRLIETTLDARSGAYRWLRRNYTEIAAVFAKQAQPSWKALAATAAAGGKDFTANTLRKAWGRLERDLEREKATPALNARPAPAARKDRPASASPVAVNTTPDDADDDPVPRKQHEWTPTKLR
jgi:hypothetical protein